jgi:hypothetical protein
MSRMSENVGASTSRNPKGLHGLYAENFTFTFLPATQHSLVLTENRHLTPVTSRRASTVLLNTRWRRLDMTPEVSTQDSINNILIAHTSNKRHSCRYLADIQVTDVSCFQL